MTLTQSRILAAGAILAAIGVAFGAFGAHALRTTLDARHLGWWNIGVQYQMWHAVGLVALAGVPVRVGLPAVLIAAGTVIFSGSLYLMALTDARWLGAVTPIGGASMIAGWVVLGWRAGRLGAPERA